MFKQQFQIIQQQQESTTHILESNQRLSNHINQVTSMLQNNFTTLTNAVTSINGTVATLAQHQLKSSLSPPNPPTSISVQGSILEQIHTQSSPQDDRSFQTKISQQQLAIKAQGSQPSPQPSLHALIDDWFVHSHTTYCQSD